MDHRFDARTRLFVLGQQLRAFTEQVVVVLAQAVVLPGKLPTQVDELLDPKGKIAQLLDVIVCVHAASTIGAARKTVNTPGWPVLRLAGWPSGASCG